ncbi:hypothetical protein O1611_g2201 [Lasiodiplodia mahajangana]|uniref:Uncharacterized protein n=1 Tax=Lasiodiplodia mahajangana TaxID=1108764 RepID=A0ACC2JVK0_9PEZI|nr:hypothetical protein O1611_g2201 [Lasiodiplodia mahajangana]
MARLDLRKHQASPIGPSQPRVEGRGEMTPETLRPRADATSTTASRQPTTSTPYAVPLTTTFIPPESCNEDQLTMLSPPGYFIWLNEPVPVPGTTVSDCYPPEFMEYYTTYHVNPTTVGSLVPLMSPLICPFGWQVVSKKGSYEACCPVGYDLTPPQTALDPDRPAYGGTCYSQWPLSSSAYVEVFGSASASGSILVTASTSGFANYAHVIDGIAVLSTVQSGSSSTQTSSESIQSESPGHTSLAPGAIAGIVIGAVAAISLLVGGFYLFSRRHRQRSGQIPPIPPPKDEVLSTTIGSPISAKSPPNYPTEAKQMQTGYSEMAAGESHIHELDAGHMPIEKP